MLVYGPSAPGDRKVWRTQCGDRPHPRDHGASTNHKTQPAWRGNIEPGVVVCAIRLGVQHTRERNHIVAVAYIEIQVNEWSGQKISAAWHRVAGKGDRVRAAFRGRVVEYSQILTAVGVGRQASDKGDVVGVVQRWPKGKAVGSAARNRRRISLMGNRDDLARVRICHIHALGAEKKPLNNAFLVLHMPAEGDISPAIDPRVKGGVELATSWGWISRFHDRGDISGLARLK